MTTSEDLQNGHQWWLVPLKSDTKTHENEKPAAKQCTGIQNNWSDQHVLTHKSHLTFLYSEEKYL